MEGFFFFLTTTVQSTTSLDLGFLLLLYDVYSGAGAETLDLAYVQQLLCLSPDSYTSSLYITPALEGWRD